MKNSGIVPAVAIALACGVRASAPEERRYPVICEGTPQALGPIVQLQLR
jgi:hypothetical protein